MVIRDLFFSEDAKSTARKPLNIAGVSDRFAAAFFDFFLFSPVVSLLLSGFLREIKTYLLLDSHSAEAGVIWVITIFAGIFITVLLQSLFLFFWGATPGQKFLHLRVVSFPQEGPLSFSQCLLRSFLGLTNFIFMGVPFLEIMSHPLRRAFHERASDTIVITLKDKLQYAPLPIERRFVNLCLRSFFVLLLGSGLVMIAREYGDAKRGLFANTADAQKLFCSSVKDGAEGETSAERLDRALALFMADDINADCLEKEADRALWDASEENKTWAYMAKGITGSDNKVQSEYFEKVCENQKDSEACVIARYLEADEASANFAFENPRTATGQILELDQQMENREFSAALGSIKKMRELEFLKAHLDRNFVRAVWSTSPSAVKPSSRTPASADPTTAEALKEFKEKFGVE